MNTEQILKSINYKPIKTKKQMGTPTRKQEQKKFTNSAPEPSSEPLEPFYKFLVEGETITGKLVKTKMIKDGNGNPVKYFVINDNDDRVNKVLPASFKLINKLNFIESEVCKNELNDIEVQIIFKGKHQHPSDPRKSLIDFDVNY